MASKDNYLEIPSIRNDDFTPGFETWLSRMVDFVNNLNSNVETVTAATPGVTYSGTTVIETPVEESDDGDSGISLSDVFKALKEGQRIALDQVGSKLYVRLDNNRIVVTEDYTASSDDYLIDVDASAGPVNVYFYAAYGSDNSALVAKKIDSTYNRVKLIAITDETIEDETYQIIKIPKTSLHFTADGISNWVLR